MNSERKIENMFMQYAELVDGGDFEGLATLLKDCTVCSPVNEAGVSGYEAILALFQTSTRIYPEVGTPRTKHVLSNLQLYVDDSLGVARANSYYTVFQGTPNLPFQPIVAGRYDDQFVCEDAIWRFSRRYIHVDFIGDVSQHLLVDIPELSN